MTIRGTRGIRVVVAAAAALALVGALAVPVTSAQAARSVVHDRRGDARASWDIARIVVSNGQKTLSMKVVYRGKLKPHSYPGLGWVTGLNIDFGEPNNNTYTGDFSVYNAIGAPGFNNGVDLLNGKARRVNCPGLRSKARVRAGIIRVSIPQRCFGGLAGRVRVAGFTYAARGAGRTADYIKHWGRWTKLG